MKLTDLKGVGQSAASKLAAAGIETVDALAESDQRQTDVTGLSRDNVARLRENARTLLEAVETGELTLVDGLGGLPPRTSSTRTGSRRSSSSSGWI